MKFYRNPLSRLLSLTLLLVILSSSVKLLAASPPDPSLHVIRDVQYTQSGTPESMDIVTPAAAKGTCPVVVYIHGGGWIGGTKYEMEAAAPYIVKDGFIFCSIDYRFATVATYPAQIEDCKCAIRFLRANAAKYHIDPTKVCVWGSSAGGHLVSLLGTTAGVARLEGTGGWQKQSSAVQEVIDWYGPTDLRIASDYTNPQGRRLVAGLLGGAPSAVPDIARDASPLVFVQRGDPPFLIMHGDRDPLVPLAQSVEFYEKLKSVGVDATLQIVRGAGHGGGEFFSPENAALVMHFMERLQAK